MMSSRNKKPINYKLLSTVGTTDSGDEFEEDARVLPLYASPGKIGESISDENVSSKSDEGEDDEMAFMMKQIQELDAQEKRLLQERKKDELRMQLEEKQRRVRSLKKGKGLSSKPAAFLSNNKVKDEHLSTESSDDKLDINSLRQMPDLNKLVQSHLKKLGLLNSESDSESDLSNIESDSETSVGSAVRSSSGKKKRNRLSTKTSGIKAKSADTVKNSQKYPHSQLRYEYVSQNIAFEDLPFNLFVAGELEIILDPQIDNTEKKGRLCLLKRIMYLNSHFSFQILRSFYAAVLREVELGEKTWGMIFTI